MVNSPLGESWDPVWTEPSTWGGTQSGNPRTLLIPPAAKSPPNHNPQAHTCRHCQSLPPIPSAGAGTGEGAGSWQGHHPRKLSICNACSAPPGTAGRLLPSGGSRRVSCFTRLPPWSWSVAGLQAGSINGVLRVLGSGAAPKLFWRNGECFPPSSSPTGTIP